MSKVEEIQKGIGQLRAAVPELLGVLLATTEGLPVAHSLADGLEPGQEIRREPEAGPMAEISVTGADAQFYIYAAGPRAVLALAAPSAANAGLIHLEARGVARGFAELF